MRLVLGFVVFAVLLALAYQAGGMPALAIVFGAAALAVLDQIRANGRPVPLHPLVSRGDVSPRMEYGRSDARH